MFRFVQGPDVCCEREIVVCGCVIKNCSMFLPASSSSSSFFADFVCWEDLDSNSNFLCVLKMYFSLPQLFVFLFDVLSVAEFVIRDRFVKKRRLLLKSLSLCNKVLSYQCIV